MTNRARIAKVGGANPSELWLQMREPVLQRFISMRASIAHALVRAPEETLRKNFGLLYDHLHILAQSGDHQEYRRFAKRFLATSLATEMEHDTVVHTLVTLGDLICDQFRQASGDISSARAVRDQARVCYSGLRIFVDVLADELAQAQGGE